MHIRLATPDDADAIWAIFSVVVAAGDTYVFAPATPRDVALAYWLNPAARTFVAEDGGRVVGVYLLKANQPGLGDHIANAAFMVDPAARGLGVGRAMGEHALIEAKRVGYDAMQFNFVVATNTAAVRLWQRLGFRIVATLPSVFRHATLGKVDAHVMFKDLTNTST